MPGHPRIVAGAFGIDKGGNFKRDRGRVGGREERVGERRPGLIFLENGIF